jgi:hypothetical protein
MPKDVSFEVKGKTTDSKKISLAINGCHVESARDTIILYLSAID